jgi:hypothetical protein
MAHYLNVSVAGLLMFASVLLPGATAWARCELAYFRKVDDKTLFDRDPGRYRTIARRTASGAEETLYIERSPAISVPCDDIKSVVVKKDHSYVMEGNVLQPRDPYYWLTFVIAPQSAENLMKYFSGRDGQSFEIQLNSEHLNFVFLKGPFRGQTFATPVDTLTEPQIRRVLQPIQNRVKWAG